VVAVLCATEIISWGTLFYALPVLASTIHADEGWALSHVIAALTIAQLVAAVAGVWVGRRMDLHGPRRLMTAGSVVGVLALVWVSAAPGLGWFYAAWVLAGVSMSATLYAPAFAAVTGWSGTDPVARVRSLTAVTLVAGFSSTIFAPLTAVLLEQAGWRNTYLVLAGILVVTVPAHWLGLSAPWTPLSHRRLRDERLPGGTSASTPLRLDFLLLTVALTLSGFCVYGSIVNLVPLLTENGLSTSGAAVALGIGGAGQVAGRLLYAPLLTRLGTRARTLVTLATVAATTAALALVHDPLALVVVLSFVAGGARGIFTLIQATAVSDRWGIGSFGLRNGIMSGSIMTASAVAPWLGAALAAALHSYAGAFLCLAAATLVAMVFVRPTGPPGREASHP
jgi:MFS family permease